MKAKNKIQISGDIDNYIYSSTGKVAGKTHDAISNLSFTDYNKELMWSVFLSNPDYIKIKE